MADVKVAPGLLLGISDWTQLLRQLPTELQDKGNYIPDVLIEHVPYLKIGTTEHGDMYIWALPTQNRKQTQEQNFQYLIWYGQGSRYHRSNLGKLAENLSDIPFLKLEYIDPF